MGDREGQLPEYRTALFVKYNSIRRTTTTTEHNKANNTTTTTTSNSNHHHHSPSQSGEDSPIVQQVHLVGESREERAAAHLHKVGPSVAGGKEELLYYTGGGQTDQLVEGEQYS